MSFIRRTTLLALAAGGIACAVNASAAVHGGHAMHHATAHAAKASSSTTAYQNAMMHMHHAMDVAFTGDPDTDFARGMIPHHEGAVAMAEVQQALGTDPELTRFSRWVATIQPQEIAMMKHWLATKGQQTPLYDAATLERLSSVQGQRAAMASMHEAMDISYTGDADIDFACGMIPHHQGAIDMAKALLTRARTPEIQTLAKNIITGQGAEIHFLRRWLQRHTGKESCA